MKKQISPAVMVIVIVIVIVIVAALWLTVFSKPKPSGVTEPGTDIAPPIDPALGGGAVPGVPGAPAAAPAPVAPAPAVPTVPGG